MKWGSGVCETNTLIHHRSQPLQFLHGSFASDITYKDGTTYHCTQNAGWTVYEWRLPRDILLVEKDAQGCRHREYRNEFHMKKEKRIGNPK